MLAPVYDILNCGPRHRFSANGKLVHNSFGLNQENLPRVSGKLSDALRNSLIAPPGHKVVVADLSGIELRVNHFLWKVPSSMALFEADPEKADLYKDLASSIFNVARDQVQKHQRQAAKAMHLGCQFGLGSAKKFVAVAKQMAGVIVTEEEAEQYIRGYREKYVEIVKGWSTCNNALPAIAMGAAVDVDPWGLVTTDKEGFVLPSGRKIRYPNMRQEVNDSGRMQWVFGEGRNKSGIYGGKAVENCIAEGTLVLTDSGWCPIEWVTDSDLVHDGDNFVRHAGLVLKSVQPCVNVDGVYMTTDHEVLDENGEWKEALENPRPYRPNVRGTDRLEHGVLRWTPHEVAVSVCMRSAGDETWGGCNGRGEARWYPELRVHDTRTNEQTDQNARDEQAPSLRRVQKHDRPLQTPLASSMEKLRRSWNNGVRTVAAFVREFLGGHGAHVPTWDGPRASGERFGVFAGELPVGYQEGKYNEPSRVGARSRYTGTEQTNRYREDHALQSAKSWMAIGQTNGATRYQKPVYDILNAGPQHRFVVLGENGPFIVHNCVQSLARDVLMDNALEIKKQTGIYPCHTVHDELIYVIPEDDAQDMLATVQSVMRTPPSWWPELVTWSEGDVADTYGAAK